MVWLEAAQLSLCSHCCAVNCGVVYVQNAARNGPVAWVLAEVLDRSVRLAENVAGVMVGP